MPNILLFGILCSCLAPAHSNQENSSGHHIFGPTEAQMENALFLSNYIRRNETEMGRNKSRVDFFKANFSVDAYSGYITTDNENTRHLFFLYTKAKEDSFNNASVVLWLYGGPGISSLTAQFIYNGPVGVTLDSNMKPAFFKRNTTFQKRQHVIYLDAPVGSGYSFTNCTTRFAKTSVEVAESIESFLVQFLELFPEMKNRTLFVNGESYASRYTVALAKRNNLSIPLGGIMLGVPVLGKVVDAMNPTSFLSCVGMLDENGVQQFTDRFKQINYFMNISNYSMALGLLSKTVLNTENQHEATLYSNLTGFSWHGSAMHSDIPYEFYCYYNLTNTSEFRNAIHVGEIPIESQRFYVVYHLASGDFQLDMKETVAHVLNSSLHVLIYTGLMDTVLPSPYFHSHFSNITWSGAANFTNATRRAVFTKSSFPLRQELRYYKKEWRNVKLIDVGRAGHYVSIERRGVVFEILNKFMIKLGKNSSKIE